MNSALKTLCGVAVLLLGIGVRIAVQNVYTDVDYYVIRDAALSIRHGGSPYVRETYRYTPFIAMLFAQCMRLGISPKMLFVAADTLTALVLARCSRTRRLQTAAFWLLNPLQIVISSRGNFDSLTTLAIAGVLLAHRRRRPVLLGFLLGFAVHFRIYPIIYAIPFLLETRTWSPSPMPRTFLGFTATQYAYAFTCFFSFLGFSLLAYWLYGMEYLDNAMLYHATRSDHRHNLSLYWYQLYFHGFLQHTTTFFTAFYKCMAFASTTLPFVLAIVSTYRLFGAKCKFKDVSLWLWALTVSFIAFNKVYTVQYFSWWMVFVPTAQLSRFGWRRIIRFLLLWAAALCAWMYFAYKLEFGGENTYMRVFFCNILLFIATVEPVFELLLIRTRKLMDREKLREKTVKTKRD